MARSKKEDSAIDNQDLADAQAALMAKAESSVAAPKSKRTTVIFHNQDGEAGSIDIFTSVNGKAYQIKREVEVELPEEVLGVIDNAIITKFSKGPKGEDVSRDVKRYPYTKV